MSIYSLEILTSLLIELRKKKIYKFNEIVLEKDLSYYIDDTKYNHIFKENDKNSRWLDLSKEIEYLKSSGYIEENKWIPNEYRIRPTISEISISPENKASISSFAKDYVFREDICKNSSIKLKIYGINPNFNHHIVKGYYDRGSTIEMEWRLLTDASNVEIKDKEVFCASRCSDSINHYNQILLWNSINAIVDVDNANFVIKQGFDRKKLQSAIIYTESLDRKCLKELVTYASSEKCEDSSVKVLSLTNN